MEPRFKTNTWHTITCLSLEQVEDFLNDLEHDSTPHDPRDVNVIPILNAQSRAYQFKVLFYYC